MSQHPAATVVIVVVLRSSLIETASVYHEDVVSGVTNLDKASTLVVAGFDLDFEILRVRLVTVDDGLNHFGAEDLCQFGLTKYFFNASRGVLDSKNGMNLHLSDLAIDFLSHEYSLILVNLALTQHLLDKSFLLNEDLVGGAVLVCADCNLRPQRQQVTPQVHLGFLDCVDDFLLNVLNEIFVAFAQITVVFVEVLEQVQSNAAALDEIHDNVVGSQHVLANEDVGQAFEQIKSLQP